MKVKTSLLSLFLCLNFFSATLPTIAQDTAGKKTVALVLGGGGARGAAHIGVLKVLEENGMRPDIVVGTSMGAIVGGLYAAGVPVDRLEKVTQDGSIKRAFRPIPVPLQLLKKGAKQVIFWRKKTCAGFYSGESLAKFINKTAGDDNNKIENFRMRYAAVVVDLRDAKAYRLEKGDLGMAARASASLPPLFSPVCQDEHAYADGGIRANVPVIPAREMGADYVIAVNVDEIIKPIEENRLYTYNDLTNRMTSIIITARDESVMKQADVVLQPDVAGIPIISVADKDYTKAMNAGELIARSKLAELKKVFALRDSSNVKLGSKVE
ncbi:MAG: patatin-like phospholipase family protein [Candidatus Melainabacteria bacterium]|nr:patatin-like phospholipase family protein [Candidatus Melainabacteria bacterium]